MKAKFYGSPLNAEFILCISIKTAAGRFDEVVKAYCQSLSEALMVQELYLNCRNSVIRKGAARSSRHLFGGGFEKYSAGWIVCHTFKIKIYEMDNYRLVSKVIQPQPYLEAISKSRE